MKTFKFHLAAIIAFSLFISACNRKGNNDSKNSSVLPDKDNGGLTLPEGFTALVAGDNLGSGRHIVVRGNGDIYLALRELNKDGGIVALRDTTGDGRADIIKYFVKTLTTGIDIKGDYLYFSNFSQVFRVPFSANNLLPSENPVVIAEGFPEGGSHPDKTFALDNSGNIYVNVGAPSNACQEKDRNRGSAGMDPCPQLERSAGIWRFRADVTGQDQVKDGKRYASGIRNSVAIAWNNSNNKLYVVQHGRDQLSQLFPEFYTEQQGAELPAEEFFLVEEGDFFGWPYCYYDQFKKSKMLAPEYGGNGQEKGRCTDAKDPIMTFPGHYAPNDLYFYTGKMFPERYRNGAFIAFHGSWNRAPLPQKGYLVAFVPFHDGLPSGEMEIFANGFAGKDVIRGPGEAAYRPMGIAEGPDGSLYISDSEKGRIWRIIYSGK
jgi:glucose/arabinose dehydrogenase